MILAKKFHMMKLQTYQINNPTNKGLWYKKNLLRNFIVTTSVLTRGFYYTTGCEVAELLHWSL